MRERWVKFLKHEQIIIRFQRAKHAQDTQASIWLNTYDARCENYIKQLLCEIDDIETQS